MDVVEIWFLIGTVIFVVVSVVLLIFFFGVLPKKREKKMPQYTTHAKVVSKTAQVEGISTAYFISFEFSDGRRKNFSMGINSYNNLVEGDFGILTYKEDNKGHIYEGFQRAR